MPPDHELLPVDFSAASSGDSVFETTDERRCGAEASGTSTPGNSETSCLWNGLRKYGILARKSRWRVGFRRESCVWDGGLEVLQWAQSQAVASGRLDGGGVQVQMQTQRSWGREVQTAAGERITASPSLRGTLGGAGTSFLVVGS